MSGLVWDRNGRLRGDTGRNGQALVELMVGLIAILALVAGLVQVVSLARSRTDSLVEARKMAGELALMGAPVAAAPEFIRDWSEGPDGRRHTRDDRFTRADAMEFSRIIVEQAAPDASGWRRLQSIPVDALSSLRGDPAPTARFGFVRGRDRREVPLLPAVQSLLYRSPSIEIESEVWLAVTGGLY